MKIDQYVLFIMLAPPALVLSLLITVYTWRRRRRPLSFQFSLMMLPVCGYLATNIAEFLAPTLELKLICAKLTYVCAPAIPLAWLAFSFDFAGKQERLTLRRIWPYAVVPIMTALLAATNELHGLIWRSVAVSEPVLLRPLTVGYGPWFWVNIAYSYALLVIGAAITAGEYFRSLNSYRRQSTLILLGMLVPLAFQIVYIFKVFPGWRKDYTPIGFAVTGAIFALGIFKYRLLRLAPIARSIILDCVSEGICVLDEAGAIVDLNRAMLEILGGEAEGLLGKRGSELLPLSLTAEPKEKNGPAEIVELQTASGMRSFELRIVELPRIKRGRIGRLVTLHDVTERERLLAEVERLAVTDPLTGLHNRRYFDARAREEIERASRRRHPLSLLMIDLDNFKLVNDELGHSVGDEVLASVASLMQATFRRVDILARYGGEEFVVLVPELPAAEAIGLAERLRARAAEFPRPTSAGAIGLTMSIGVAGLSGSSPQPLAALIRSADAALYEAKGGGKNCVRCARESGVGADAAAGPTGPG